MAMVPGNVVIINGPSSAGKTSVARALQGIMERPYLRMGIDEFLPCLPPGLVQAAQVSDGAAAGDPPTYMQILYRMVPAADAATPARSQGEASTGSQATNQDGSQAMSRVMTGVRIGPEGLRFFAGMYHAMAAFAEQGIDIIVESIIYEPRVLRELVLAFRDLPALLVGLRVPREVVARRERERGDREVGVSTAFYDGVHAHGVYDLEFDTSLVTPMECAQRIKQALATGHPRTALRQLADGFAL